MFLAYYVHEMDPFLGPHWGNFGLRYYGLSYVIGFLGAWALLRLYYRKQRSPFDTAAIADLMTYIVFGVLIGGRLGYFFLYQADTLVRDPLALFRVWDGGMASHGGFVGVALALGWWAQRQKVRLVQVSDLIATVTPFGLMLGRIANFINGELPGKVTSVPWAVIFPHHDSVDRLPRHPSQLYQAALEGGLLLAYMQWRFWRSDAQRTQPGRLTGEFLIGYAILRMIGEIFREPDASLFFGVSRGTFYSVFLIVAGVIFIARSPRQQASNANHGTTE